MSNRQRPSAEEVISLARDRAGRDGGAAPRLLLVSVLPYLLCPQLVLAFQRVGFAVEVVCPQRHPVHLLRRPPPHHDLGVMGATSVGPLGACAAVASAMAHAGPDLVVPCDDQAAQIVRAVAATASPKVKRLIERSLGPARHYPLLDSRSAQVGLAASLGLRTPRSVVVADRAGLAEAARALGLPACLKRDGTWAGEGVKKVCDEAQMQAAFARLSRAHTFRAALGRVPTTGWRHAFAAVRRTRPALELQALVAGRPANRAVLCQDGDVLGGISVLALETTSETGPASVVRVIDHDEMTQAAARLAKHLRINGFLGVDFIVSDTGEASFLEINARPTPASLLSVARSTDLISLLFRAVTGREPPERSPIAAELIALFPQEIVRDRASPYLQTAYHDIPSDEPRLVAYGMKQAVAAVPGSRSAAGLATARVSRLLGGMLGR